MLPISDDKNDSKEVTYDLTASDAELYGLIYDKKFEGTNLSFGKPHLCIFIIY